MTFWARPRMPLPWSISFAPSRTFFAEIRRPGPTIEASKPRPEGGSLPQEQEQKRIQRKGGGDRPADSEAAGQTTAAKKGAKLKEEMDEMLEEIDEVLEENAEEFIKSYVQKGGE
jgi:prokaryotic ubiquitin-like protein Pup